jgi:hypothetical protein
MELGEQEEVKGRVWEQMFGIDEVMPYLVGVC